MLSHIQQKYVAFKNCTQKFLKYFLRLHQYDTSHFSNTSTTNVLFLILTAHHYKI